MRILINADTYAPDVNGAAYFAQRLAAGLAGRGHDVHVVCPARSVRGTTRVVAATVRRHITEHRVASLPVPRPAGFRIATPGGLVERSRRLLMRVRPTPCTSRARSSSARRSWSPPTTCGSR